MVAYREGDLEAFASPLQVLLFRAGRQARICCPSPLFCMYAMMDHQWPLSGQLNSLGTRQLLVDAHMQLVGT